MTNNNASLIFGAAATILSAGAVVLGIFGAKKAAEVKKDAEFNLSVLDEKFEKEMIEEDEYDKAEKDIKVKKVVKTVAWYTPAAVCEIGSIACIFFGQKYLLNQNKALMDQNSQLTANLAAVAGSLSKQREVFKEALGEQKYREISNGITTETYEALTEKGKQVKKHTQVVSRDKIDDSSFIFGPYKADGTVNPKWSTNLEDNYSYVDSMQDFFNDILDRKPIIFRNEVVSHFDDSFEAQTEYGQYFGKTASLRNPNETDVRLSATEYMIRDPHGNLVDCLLVQTNLNESVAKYLN
jgi:hypothetical protein